MRYPTPSEAGALVIILIVVLSVYRAHKNPNVDFNALDLIMQNGRVDRIACITMGTWLALVFVFIGTYLDNKMTEGLYTAFGGLCFAPLIAKMFSTSQPSAIASSTTTSTVEIVK